MSTIFDSTRSQQTTVSPEAALRRLFLTLFLRGRSARHLQKDKAPKSVGQKLALTLLFYALFGLFALMFLNQSVFLLSAYMHGMTLVFLGMFVASSAGEILFNREEADILLHRPIEPRDLLRAKVRVLTEVSLWLAGAFNLVTFVAGVFARDGGWRYPLVHALSMTLQAVFCTGGVVLAYQLCLRWLGRERLEGLMTTAQVALSVAAVAGGQLIPMLADVGVNGQITIADRWWLSLLPPAWFAGMDDALAGSGSVRSWGLAAIGCAVTAAVLWLAFNRLAAQYEAGLQLLNESSRRTLGGGGRRWLDRMLDLPPLCWWLRDPKQRASFLLTAAYLGRDRDVKLRVYPAVAPFLIFPVIFLLREFGDSASSMEGFGFTFASGYIGTVPLMAVSMLQFSEHWQAADIFRAAPMPGPAPLCHGLRKAALFLLTMPLVLALALCAWLISGDFRLTALLLPGLILVPLLAILPCWDGKAVPLSRPAEAAKSGSRGLLMVLAMFVTMGLSAVAALAWHAGWFGWLMGAELAVALLLYVALYRDISCATWPSLD